MTADVEGRYLQAGAKYEADLEPSKPGLMDKITLMKSWVSMEELNTRLQSETVPVGGERQADPVQDPHCTPSTRVTVRKGRGGERAQLQASI